LFSLCLLSNRDFYSFPTRRSSDLIWRDSPAEMAKTVDVVLYMVPAIADIRDSLLSHDGLLSGQMRELTVIIGSTVSASAVKDLRSEEHTSELQSRFDLVCRLLLEK